MTPTPVPTQVSMPKPTAPAAGMIPLSPATLPSRRNSTPGLPRYNEYDSREISEFMEPVPEMQGAGGLEAGHWEMQG